MLPIASVYLQKVTRVSRQERKADIVSGESVLLRLRDVAGVGELRSVLKLERLQVREADERVLALDVWNEGIGKLDELGEHDTLKFEAGGRCRRGYLAPDERELGARTYAADGSGRWREKVAAR